MKATTNGLQVGHAANEIVEGGDIIVQSPPATGKTISFCISALQNIDPDIKGCQVLILAPTSNMSRQLQKTISDLARFLQMDCPACVGGRPIQEDINTLHDGQQVVVGSPGRTLELIRRGAITVENTKLFALNEADEIFARGFEEHVLDIHRLVPEVAQVVFSAATMPDDVLEAATSLMRNPLHIIIKGTGLTFRGVKQFCVAVESDDLRLDLLSDLSTTLGEAQVVIFCNTRKKLEWLSSELTSHGISHTTMHYDKPAFERADIVKEFRARSSRILLVTNMLARGLIVQQTSLVVNYELPAKVEDYIHRTNRSGSLKRECITVNLMSSAEVPGIHDIEQHYRTQVEEVSISEAKKLLDFTGDTSYQGAAHPLS